MTRLKLLLAFSLFATLLPAQHPDSLTILKQVKDGYKLLDQGGGESAYNAGKAALKRAREARFAYGEYLALNLMAYYEKLSSYETALSTFREALNIAQSLSDNVAAARTLTNIAILEDEYGEPETAKLRCREALDLLETTTDTLNKVRCYQVMANALENQDSLFQAFKLNETCRDLLAHTRYYPEIASNYYGLGCRYYIFYYRGDDPTQLSNAKNAFREALRYYKRAGYKSGERAALSALGALSAYLPSDLNEGRSLLRESLREHAVQKDTLKMLSTWYNRFETEFAHEEIDSAHWALEQLKSLIDTFSKNIAVDSIQQMSMPVLSTRITNVDPAIAKMEQDLEVLEFKIHAQNADVRKNIALGLLVGLLIIGFLIIRFIQVRKKIAEQELELQRNRNERLLRDQERILEETRLNVQEETRRQMGILLHDGVGSMLIAAKWRLEAIYYQAEETQNPLQEDLKSNLELLNMTHGSLRQLAHAMENDELPWWEELATACRKLPAVRLVTFGLDKTAGGKFGNETRLVVWELLSNALNHSGAESIEIAITQSDDQLSIVVGDDGKGLPGTLQSDGKGLQHISERVRKLNGKIEYDNGKGVTVFVDLPLPKVRA